MVLLLLKLLSALKNNGKSLANASIEAVEIVPMSPNCLIAATRVVILPEISSKFFKLLKPLNVFFNESNVF